MLSVIILSIIILSFGIVNSITWGLMLGVIMLTVIMSIVVNVSVVMLYNIHPQEKYFTDMPSVIILCVIILRNEMLSPSIIERHYA